MSDESLGDLRETAAAFNGVKDSAAGASKALRSFTTTIGTVTGGAGSSGNNILNNSLSSIRQTNDGQTGMGMGGRTRNIMGWLGSVGLNVGAAYAQGKYDAMPDVQNTVARATGFYNAGLYGTMAGGAAGMQNATFTKMKGAITSQGSDARTAEFLASRGMTQNMSNYLGTVGAVANSAKYLNMSNERSSAALEGLTSGQTSSSLMRNLGIYTSDPTTGKAYSQSQIFGQVAQRLTAGQSMATADQVNESFRRGKLGASLSGLGMSEDQQHMMHMFMLARSQGVNLDLENEKSVKAFAEKNGFNPAQMGYQINTADAGAQNAAQGNYIQSIKNVIPEIERLSKEAGDLAAGPVGSFKAMKAALESSVAGNAAVTSATAMVTAGMTALATAIGGLIGTIGMRGLGGGVGGPVGPVGTPTGKGAKVPKGYSPTSHPNILMNNATGKPIRADKVPGFKPPTGAANPLLDAGKTLAKGNIIGSAVMGGVSLAMDAANGQGWGTKQFSQNMGSTIGGVLGGALGLIPVPGLNIALGIGGSMLGSAVGGWLGGMMGSGGTNSTINANGPTGNSQQNAVKFTWPAGNASLVSDGFGPRTPPTPGASSYHRGIDISVGMGTPIMASADGEVIQAGNNGGLGNCVSIKHANGYTTIYGHQSRIATSVGKKVTQGQVIGYVGSTGVSTGAHLHFEVKDASGKHIDPMQVLNGTASATYASEDKKSGSSGSSAPASDISGVIDSRAKAGIMTVSSYQGARTAGGGAGNGMRALSLGSNASTKDTMALGTGASGKNNLTSGSMGIYLPGARRAKTGDPYVANDGPVNVHSGEAILTSEQADVWRTALKQGGLGKGGGNNVTINLTIAQASDDEARKFANTVKDLLEKDTMIKSMGSK